MEGREIKLQTPREQTEENYATTHFPGTTNFVATPAAWEPPRYPSPWVSLQSVGSLFAGAHSTVVRNRSGVQLGKYILCANAPDFINWGSGP